VGAERDSTHHDAHEPAAPEAAPAPAGSPQAMGLWLASAVGNRAFAALARQQAPDPPAGGAAPAPAGDAPKAGAAGLIVEDDVADLRPEQMRRGDFMNQARGAAIQGARAGAGPAADRAEGQTADALAPYGGLGAAELERRVRAEVSGAAGVATAAEMVAAVRSASENEARAKLSEGVSDSAASLANDAMSGVSNAVGTVASAVSSTLGMLLKARSGASPDAGPGDVESARARLGRGEPVPGEVRSEVERVTGADLSGVRLHRGGAAGDHAASLGARAFAVGPDVVVAPGEAAAGTPVGDALLAHELAHSAQQLRGAANEPATKSADTDEAPAEAAADEVAVAAVVGRWTGIRHGIGALGATVARRLRTGLSLQRCGSKAIDPTKEALNKKVLEGMKTANTGTGADAGIHYPYNYERDFPDAWSRLGKPKDGYADPKFWRRVDFMHWVRKPGVSASAAMDAWFRGPTIADCASVATASEVNALRAALGDAKFDKLFGGEGKPPMEQEGKRYNLEIGQGSKSSVVADLMRQTASATDAGQPGRRNVQPGEWHYFANHPAYVKKHPTGYWQGENALFKGEENGQQMWSGFGAPGYTEQKMNETLVSEYNAAPKPEDVEKRKHLYDQHGPDVAKWPEDVKRFHGDYPDRIDVPTMIAAGGGFQGGAGQELDPAKVQALANKVKD
jgi:hypothetical protein